MAATATARLNPPVLPPLLIRARRLVWGHYLGSHKSSRRGSGTEFAEYRSYHHGDPIKEIDWRVFARSDRLFIRLREEEVARRVWIVIDDSPSMDFGAPETKFDRARLAAAAIGLLAQKTGDSVGLRAVEGKLSLPCRCGAAHRVAFLRALEELRPQTRPHPGAETTLTRTLASLTPRERRGRLLILLSDFLTDLGPLTGQLRLWSQGGGDLIACHFLAREEWDLDGTLPARFYDPETHREVPAHPPESRARYREALHQHIQRVRGLVTGLGFDYGLVRGDEELRAVLMRLLRRRTRARGGRTR